MAAPFRFLHAADIHLDSPLRGLEDYPGAPAARIRGATREALVKLIDLALEERVAFVVIAGDLFDQDWKDFNSALFAANQMSRLRQAGIPVYLILGNHDAYLEMSRKAPWPANVHLFDHQRPETIQLDALHVALHGMSFPRREVRENLVPQYGGPVAGWFNIGLLHTNANGSPNHDSYAPCGLSELVAKGYDYWALGHVHDFQVLHEHPHVVYSGNLQGRHVRESGAKGAVVVSVADGEVRDLSFRELDVLRWHHTTITLLEEDDLTVLTERVRGVLESLHAAADGRLSAVRLRIEGRCAAHRQLAKDAARQSVISELRLLAAEFGGDIWLEKIKFATQSPLDLDALRQGPDLVGELLRSIATLVNDPTQLQEFATILQPLATKVGSDLKENAAGEAIEFQDSQLLTEWVREAERLLLERLVESSQ